jgi:hypothetical protein
MHEVQRNSVSVVFELLAEAVRQAGEPPHGHTHREVLAFHIARADVVRIRITTDNFRRPRGATSGYRSSGYRSVPL